MQLIARGRGPLDEIKRICVELIQVKKSVSTELTRTNIAEIQDLLAEAPKKLERFSEGLSVEQFAKALGRGERSFTENLAHMLHCEARSSEATYLALLANEPTLAGIHSERDFGNLVRYDLQAFSDLLAYFKFRRNVLLRVLSSLTDKQWSRGIREAGKQRKESVYWQARGIAMHEVEHVSEMERKLKEESSSRRFAKRAVMD
jgi:hypothetical protein